jgi:hypothetical protein
MLLTAYLLSVFKPWGRIRPQRPAPDRPATTMTMASERSGSSGAPVTRPPVAP